MRQAHGSPPILKSAFVFREGAVHRPVRAFAAVAKVLDVDGTVGELGPTLTREKSVAAQAATAVITGEGLGVFEGEFKESVSEDREAPHTPALPDDAALHVRFAGSHILYGEGSSSQLLRRMHQGR